MRATFARVSAPERGASSHPAIAPATAPPTNASNNGPPPNPSRFTRTSLPWCSIMIHLLCHSLAIRRVFRGSPKRTYRGCNRGAHGRSDRRGHPDLVGERLQRSGQVAGRGQKNLDTFDAAVELLGDAT